MKYFFNLLVSCEIINNHITTLSEYDMKIDYRTIKSWKNLF